MGTWTIEGAGSSYWVKNVVTGQIISASSYENAKRMAQALNGG